MNDLISKSKILKWLEIQIANCSKELKRELFAEDLVTVSKSLDTFKKVYDNIKDMTPLQLTDSAADVQPVAHGEWIDKPYERWKAYDIRYCSKCNWSIHKNKLRCADLNWSYCPNCGAKMDLERGDT